MSFFLIRLLQNFSHMEMDLSAQPLDARPPQEWAMAEGHKGKEKIVVKTHLTLYVHVSISIGCVVVLGRSGLTATWVTSGRAVGQDDRGGA